MSNSMGLPIPIVGVDTGPNWANAINNCLNVIAEHTHAAGSGVQITPNGLNINAPLLFNGNPLQSAAYLNMLPQGVGVAVPINDSLYISGVDLFFRDGSGNNIRVTQGGNVLASSSGISLGTASASFVGNVLTVTQAPGVAAPIDAASYILRYNGSYPTPAGLAVILQAPSSLISSYALTFPTVLPSINNSLLASNTSGALSFRSPDQVAADMTSVGTNAIIATMGSSGANTISDNRTRGVGISVPAGGVAISNSCNSFVTTSTSLVDVTNLSVTITTTGRPVFLMLISDGTLNNSSVAAQTGSTVNAVGTRLSFVRGGTEISRFHFFLTGAPSLMGLQDAGNITHVDPVAAGTYTYKVQTSTTAGTPSSAVVFSLKLVAYEL